MFFRTVWRRALSAAILFAAAPKLYTQTQSAPPENPEINLHEAQATFSSRANLVMVPVVVRDARGKTVGTLRQADFQLFDKGKRQPITRFSLEKAGGTPEDPKPSVTELPPDPTAASAPFPLAEHFVAYLFDDLHMTVSELLEARTAATRHFEQPPPDPKQYAGTRFAILTTSGRSTLDFTDDRTKLRETLAKLQPRTSNQPERDCPQISYYLADLIENKNDQQALAVAIAAAHACTTVVLPPAPPQAQVGIDLFELMVRAISTRVVQTGESDTRLALRVLSDLVRRMTAAPGSRAIVVFSPGFLLTETHRDESDVMDRAIRANVIINTVDARGLFVIPGNNQVGMAQYNHDAALSQADVLAEVAGGTGGIYFHGDNNLEEGLLRASENPEFHYVLGFAPQDLKLDGSFHAIKVTVAGSRYTVQARRGYYAPVHSDDPEGLAKEEIEEALFSRDERRDFPVDLHTQFFKTSDTQAKLAVVVRLDAKSVHFRKVDGRNRDKLTILSGLFDRNGNYITGVEKVLDMNLRDQTLESVTQTGILIRSNFDVSPGGYVVRLVVRDAEGQALAVRNGAVEIP
jgi:VWFA-related protein